MTKTVLAVILEAWSCPPNFREEDVATDYAEFGAKVPREEYDRFKKNFPIYGATNWLINEAVREVNRLVEEDAGVRDIVQKAIQRMLQNNRSK